MADGPEPRKTHPVFRLLAGFMCLVFLALAVLFFPLGGLAEQPWLLTVPFGALVGAFYCGKVAATGRAPRWP
jgi:hypothetical protein